MRKSSIDRALCTGFAILATLFVACGDEPAQPATPGIQPEIINSVDNFQFQLTAVENYTGTLNYNWSNTGPAADVNQACAVSGGTVTLTLFDEGWNTVYTRDLSQNGSYASSTGISGNWRIRITMTGATGDLNFRADKRTP
jgi:hypothetical protein